MLIRIPEQEGDEIRWFRAFLLFLSRDNGRPVVRAPRTRHEGSRG